MIEYNIPGVHVREHRVAVPLDWSRPDDGEITLFVLELAESDRIDEELPVLVFLQGGPGGKSPRPLRKEGWIAEALRHYRVLLLDQRGTGRSSKVTAGVIGTFDSADDAAQFLLLFRADSIVRDLEHLRRDYFRLDRWTTLGQSYGGFITLRYLSAAPEGLDRCLVAGGLASLHPDAEEVYRRTYPRVAEKTRRYYERFPADSDRIGAIADILASSDVRLPDGDRLTVRRFQTLGLGLGMSTGAQKLHWLVDEALSDDTLSDDGGSAPLGDPGPLGDAFLESVMRETSYWENPLFAVMQESIYGSGAGSTGWAAERERSKRPGFGIEDRPLMFTGEMMYPWMFEEIKSLRPFARAAEALARVEDYSPLYDLDRLASNEVPVSAVVYFDDMYVDAGLSMETAAAVGNVTTWVTNEYQHDGLRDGTKVFERLVAPVDG